MRLLKAQNTNQRNIKGNGVKYDVDDQVIMDSNNVLLIPKGSLSERPANPTNGHIRFNTDDDQFEAYQDGEWRELRFKEPFRDPGITQQYLGDGDLQAGKTVFGPLDSGDTDYPVPATAKNILVFVENVYQIPGPLLDSNTIEIHNYTLQESTVGIPLSDPTNASYAPGWYIVFESPPDDGKPVVVTHNFDK
jgi:hypothetical protein